MTRILLAASAVAALAVAGCGSSSSTTSATTTAASTPATTTTSTTSSTPAAAPASSGSSKVLIAANPSGMLAFSTTSLKAKAGKVTIDFTNQAPVPHNFTLATSSGTVLGATPTFSGGSKTLTVTLKAGSYTYYCSVPGHRQAGMQGTLVVS
jgi:plastocyanin